MADEQLVRIAKAIHTLFYATEAAGVRYRALEASITTDDDLAAFQALSIGLINFEPIPPEALARAQERFSQLEQEESERPTEPSERIRIEAGTRSPEALYFKRLLERMYTRWQGTLDYESGVHRLSFYSPFDEQGRRYTSFAQVYVDGDCPDLHARNYILGPYLKVADYRTKRESDDPWKVLNGDLTPVLPEATS